MLVTLSLHDNHAVSLILLLFLLLLFFRAIFDNVFVVVVLFSRPFFQICSLERRFQIMTTANCKLLSKNVCSRKVARYRVHSP